MFAHETNLLTLRSTHPILPFLPPHLFLPSLSRPQLRQEMSSVKWDQPTHLEQFLPNPPFFQLLPCPAHPCKPTLASPSLTRRRRLPNRALRAGGGAAGAGKVARLAGLAHRLAGLVLVVARGALHARGSREEAEQRRAPGVVVVGGVPCGNGADGAGGTAGTADAGGVLPRWARHA